MRKFILVMSVLAISIFSINAKKVLDHSSFDDWKSVRTAPLSNDGVWATYMVNPQEGDGVLTFRNVKTGKEVVIERGYNPQFTADAQWAVALIKPFYAATRQAKIDKKKDFDMPQDSLAIVNLKTMEVKKWHDDFEYETKIFGLRRVNILMAFIFLVFIFQVQQ